MTTIRPREHVDEMAADPSGPRHDRIGAQVLRALGRPPDLIRAQVRPLWGTYYRVNVLVGADASCATVRNSYFVRTDDDGTILVSTPVLTKGY